MSNDQEKGLDSEQKEKSVADDWVVDETIYAETAFDLYHPVSGVTKEELIAKSQYSNLAPGDLILNTYEVLEKPINSKMGRIIHVRHTGWGVELAIKQPHRDAFATVQDKELFSREAEEWVKLGLHPNIVSCYYVRALETLPAIFTEWMDGGNLSEWIRKTRKSLPKFTVGDQPIQDYNLLERILDISIQIARGLNYAHSKGLIHRDVKPSNILLTTTGESKIADFGIAAINVNIERYANPKICGTRQYASLDVWEGKEATVAMDAYSFSVTILEMFTLERHWQEGDMIPFFLEDYLSNYLHVAMPEAMKQLLREFLIINPNNNTDIFKQIEQRLLGIYLVSIGHTYPRKVIDTVMDTADILNNRALSYLDLGDSESAEKCWKEALDIDPAHIQTIYNKSLFEWRIGKCDDQVALERLSNLTNAHLPIVQYLLALIHLERADPKSAKFHLKNALRDSNGDLRYKRAIEELKKHYPIYPRLKSLEMIDETDDIIEEIQKNKIHWIERDVAYDMCEEINERKSLILLNDKQPGQYTDLEDEKEDKFDIHDLFYNPWFYPLTFSHLMLVEDDVYSTLQIFDPVIGRIFHTCIIPYIYEISGLFEHDKNRIMIETIISKNGGCAYYIFDIPTFTWISPWEFCLVSKTSEVSDNDIQFRKTIAIAKKNQEEGNIEASLISLQNARKLPGFKHTAEWSNSIAKLTPFCRKKGFHSFYRAENFQPKERYNDNFAITPDGKLLIAIVDSYSLDKNLFSKELLHIMDAKTGALQKIVEINNDSFALSPDGTHLLFYRLDSQQRMLVPCLHNINTGAELIYTPDFEYIDKEQYDYLHRCDMCYHQNGKIALARGRLWDINNLKPLKDLKGLSSEFSKSYENQIVFYFPDGEIKETWRNINCSAIPFTNSDMFFLVLFSNLEYKTSLDFHFLASDGIYSASPAVKVLLKCDNVETACLTSDDRYLFVVTEDNNVDISFVLFDNPTFYHTLQKMIDHPEDGSFGRDNKFDFAELNFKPHFRYHKLPRLGMRTLRRFYSGGKFCCFAPDDSFAITNGKELIRWNFDWEYEFPGWSNWDEDVSPILEKFLKLFPNWSDDDFNNYLIPELQNRGFGWIRPEGIRSKLIVMS